MSDKEVFIDSVKSKIDENCKAFNLLYENKLYGACIATLRMQLDILVRINFLRRPSSNKNELLYEFAHQEKWDTDKYMMSFLGFGWDQLVYKFGCSFIHLSRLSNYDKEDILNIIDPIDKENIIKYTNQYHEANLNEHSTLNEIFVYLPNIHKKIADHNYYYLDKLSNII